MPDPHNSLLASFYTCKIEAAKSYLKIRYPLTVCDAGDKEVKEISKRLPEGLVPSEFWKLQIDGSLQKFTFLIAVPNSFPDSFPKIYLQKKDYEKISPIPHLDKERFICTRDPEVVVLNDLKSGEAVEELLKTAVGIIESGIKKENQYDYVEEFLAYWAEKADNVFLCLFTPKDAITFLKVFTLSDKLFDAWYVLADSRIFAEKWLAPFKKSIAAEMIALYLPLHELSAGFFDRKRGVLEILKNLKDHEAVKVVENYFNQSKGRITLVLSFPVKGERILLGWTFPGWKNVKGFRKGHAPLNVRLTQTDHTLIRGISIRRMDRERILKRGGIDRIMVGKESSVAIVGCGSLGSHLAMSLARCGISRYLLIDKEKLEPENVARHLCGFVDASRNMNKVEAVKKRLTEHFPDIECDVYTGDVLQLLIEKGIGIFEDHDLVVVALGNLSVERRINYLTKMNETTLPVVYLWIEPFGVGGHLLYVHPRNGGCFECCFNERGEFHYQIAPKGQEFSKREPGCQSTYLPYASLEVEHFISVACRQILNIIEGKEAKSKLHTWLGDLEGFKNLGYQLSDAYVADLPHTVLEKEILPNQRCTLCQDRKQIA